MCVYIYTYRLNYLDLSGHHWCHEVREGLRQAAWSRAAERRQDMAGIEFGVDRPASLALYRQRRTSEYEKGILRAILSGAIWTQARLHKAGRVFDAKCPYCGQDCVEDLAHMWWECAAWNHIRHEHHHCLFAFKESWPACLLQCGVMPERHPGLDHLDMGLDMERSNSEREDDQQMRPEGEIDFTLVRTSELWSNERVV
eukprot:473526-Karenia_brevis.AAC.1